MYIISANGIQKLSKASHPGANHMKTEDDGTIVLEGDATVWEDLRIPLYARGGGTAPTFASGFAENATLYTWKFSGNSTNNMYFEAQMPHSWAGTTIYPHVHWSPTTTGTGNVNWYFEYVWSDVGGTYGTSSVLTTSSNIETASRWKHIIASNESGITPNANQKGLSSLLLGRLYRAGGSSGDTYAGDASLISIDIHYELNTLGSREVLSK